MIDWLIDWLIWWLLVQLRVALMDLMRDAEVTDAETGRPITGPITDTDQSPALQQPPHSTDDLAALDKLDEVIDVIYYI